MYLYTCIPTCTGQNTCGFSMRIASYIDGDESVLVHVDRIDCKGSRVG